MSSTAFESLCSLDAAAREHAARHPIPPAVAAPGPTALLAGVAGREVEIPLSQVRAVQRCPGLAPVPGGREWLAGMTAMDGRAVAVLDVARLAFERPTPVSQDATLLLCAVDDDRVGLLVDEVLETAAESSPAAPSPEWLHEAGNRLRLDVAALLAEVVRRGAGRRGRLSRRPPPAPEASHAG